MEANFNSVGIRPGNQTTGAPELICGLVAHDNHLSPIPARCTEDVYRCCFSPTLPRPTWQPRAVKVLATVTYTIPGILFRSQKVLLECLDLLSMVKPVETPQGEDEQQVLAIRAPAQTC